MMPISSCECNRIDIQVITLFVKFTHSFLCRDIAEFDKDRASIYIQVKSGGDIIGSAEIPIHDILNHPDTYERKM
jgi:hypothetical protein